MLHYFGYYVRDEEKRDYLYYVPGKLKMDYMISCFKRIYEHVAVISLCYSKNIKKRRTLIDKEGVSITYLFSFGKRNKLYSLISKVLKYIQLVLYLLFKTSKKDTVVIYHSYIDTCFFCFIKKLIKRKYVLEIEEIYAFSASGIKKSEKKELKKCKKFDKYIVVNDTLPSVVGISNYVVCYGSYFYNDRFVDRFNDKKIHIVYAGTIESKKMGAINACRIAKYLSGNYVLHIAGFGSEKDVALLKREILTCKSKCDIIFHGFLDGKKNIELMQKCHIGLSTYIVEDLFSSCSFPSKLTTYVCNDLIVCVNSLPTYKHALIAKNWIFYDDFHPRDIAKTIMDSKLTFCNNKELILSLDSKLVNDLRNLFND